MGPSASPAGEPSRPPPEQADASHVSHLAVEQEGATLYLRPEGEFNRACGRRVEAVLDRISATLTRRVVFDLRGLSFLDLAGLKTILKANERARTERFEVVVVRPRGHLNRIFTLTRAGERLTMIKRA